MNKYTTRASVIFLSLLLTGCSDTSDTKSSDASAVEPNADTSYLDELAAKQGIELNEESAEEQTTNIDLQIDDAVVEDADDPAMIEDEQREWELERESKSLLGRSRDKGLDLRDQLQGSTSPGEGLAYTISEEEYAASSGLRWEMPENWRMAVPPRGRFAEMYIKNVLGNASVSFTKETENTRNLVRRMQGQIISATGGRSRARTTNKTIGEHSVQFVDLDGTYIDPGSKGGAKEQIFYAIHAVIFDLGDSRILIKMWGPQDTVNQNKPIFDAMIDNTSTQ
ncbi:MAG: hypothetical protein JKY43_02845 [Phycisphaerales bacterium]|nr:hypothetical protein [Phycisphaerales bacterium]